MAGRGWQISSEEQDSHEFFHAVITTLREELYHFRCGSNEIMDLSVCKGKGSVCVGMFCTSGFPT